jgi:hypothetical protein
VRGEFFVRAHVLEEVVAGAPESDIPIQPFGQNPLVTHDFLPEIGRDVRIEFGTAGLENLAGAHFGGGRLKYFFVQNINSLLQYSS